MNFMMTGGTSNIFMARLVPSRTAGGALTASFFDGEEEELYIAIKPASGSSRVECVAFSANGAEVSVHTELHDVDNGLFLDDYRLERAATQLQQAAGLAGGESAARGSAVGASATVGGGSAQEADGVRALLTKARLEQYTDAFLEEGWDDVEYITSTMDVEALEDLAASVGMKKGHLEKFKALVRPDLVRR